MDKRVYKRDLKEAREELDGLLEKRAALDKKIAKLLLEIGSLARLTGGWDSIAQLISNTKKATVQELGLKASCREVLLAADDPLTPSEVVQRIEELGLRRTDASLLASIHTTLRRMAQQGQAEEMGTKAGRKAYKLVS